MKLNILKSALLLSVACFIMSYDMPRGWRKAGNADKYDMGTDVGAGRDNKNAATIKSNSNEIKGYGTMLQDFLPDKYIGKRIRYTAYLKAKDVSGWSGLLLRIEGKKAGSPVAFDNMHYRSVKGTQDWAKYEIVLDVPKNASKIVYGAILSGTGQIWFDGINIEVVPDSVPTTDVSDDGEKREPTNLNFEK